MKWPHLLRNPDVITLKVHVLSHTSFIADIQKAYVVGRCHIGKHIAPESPLFQNWSSPPYILGWSWDVLRPVNKAVLLSFVFCIVYDTWSYGFKLGKERNKSEFNGKGRDFSQNVVVGGSEVTSVPVVSCIFAFVHPVFSHPFSIPN